MVMHQKALARTWGRAVSHVGSSAEPNWPDSLAIGTASPGGTYYVYGEGLAKILTTALEIPVTMLPTEGPAQNIELLEGLTDSRKMPFAVRSIFEHRFKPTRLDLWPERIDQSSIGLGPNVIRRHEFPKHPME